MAYSTQFIPYQQTDAFSRLTLDYVHGDFPTEFFEYVPGSNDVLRAIGRRRSLPCNREALVDHLFATASGIVLSELTEKNIRELGSTDTFTVCTAHQPNLFTGHLYFIYKILHVIKLADQLNRSFPSNHFVPVYYMGSEDADLQELGSFEVQGKKYQWTTGQTGAVGRMRCDRDLIHLIDELERQLGFEPFGNEMIRLLRDCYLEEDSIERCTYRLVNQLFGKYGLVIFLPDHAFIKSGFIKEFSLELDQALSAATLRQTLAKFPPQYKIQAEGRDINLFYLDGDKRERIEQYENGSIRLVESGRILSRDAWGRELKEHPERFSPNVILRPVFQEKLLPNIIFIGGGSELSYWLELKEVFAAFAVPFPMILLRNSFQIFEKASLNKLAAIGLQPADIFLSEKTLEEKLTRAAMSHRLDLEAQRQQLAELYDSMAKQAALTDVTLQGHVRALEKKAGDKIIELEKKILRAAKRKNSVQIAQLKSLLAVMKPGNNLQERVDNILPYFARYGSGFIDSLLESSLGFEQEFCMLLEQ